MSNIGVKSEKILLALMLNEYDPILCLIALDVAEKIINYGKTPMVTSAFRDDDVGVHGQKPCRGIDLRSRDLRRTQAIAITDEINQKWIYDQSRPDLKVIVFHDTGRGPHFHIQSHPRTKLAEQ